MIVIMSHTMVFSPKMKIMMGGMVTTMVTTDTNLDLTVSREKWRKSITKLNRP